MIICCILGNVFSVIYFTVLAIVFNKWWIALLSIFFLADYKDAIQKREVDENEDGNDESCSDRRTK